MLFLTVIVLFVGVMYLWMGFSILFLKKYGLINNYFADIKAGKFGEDYARRVGAISLISGIMVTGLGVAALLTGGGLGMAGLLLLGVLASLAAFRINYVRSDRLRA